MLGLDRETRWIQRFDKAGRWLGRLGGPGRLSQPESIAVAPDGSILVADSGGNSLLRFGPDGALLGRAGVRGKGPGQLDRPVAVAVAGDGTVYVADAGNQRVERFSLGLDYQGEWAVPRADVDLGPLLAVADADGGAVYVVDPHGGQVQRFTPTDRREWSLGSRGDGPLQFLLPLAVATDSVGNVYVLDTRRHQIYRYDVSRRLK